MGNEFEKNHYFPKYNLQYWKKEGSNLYDKAKKEDRKFNPANNFHLYKFYYFDGTPEIEKRLGKIENYMSTILKKISNSITKKNIELSEYEISFIQLFLFLQSSRQLNTTEVIKSDESNIYQSNNFLFGNHNLKTKEQMETQMRSLIKALECMIKKKNSEELTMWMNMQITQTHLVIAKNSNNEICQSDVCCIIENDMDSNHMYTYFPQTPNIAFFLVKTKYFYRNFHRLSYLERTESQEISPILQDSETKLICQYPKEGFFEENTGSSFSLNKSIIFTRLRKNKINLNFIELTTDIVNQYNKILFDDGTIFIHHQEKKYISFLDTVFDDYRRIIVCEPNSTDKVDLNSKLFSFQILMRLQPRKANATNQSTLKTSKEESTSTSLLDPNDLPSTSQVNENSTQPQSEEKKYSDSVLQMS